MFKGFPWKSGGKKEILLSSTIPPAVVKHALNIWGPFRGAGIRVHTISPDFRHICVKMAFGALNANINGSHFGGSLYAMTDPFYALMLMKALGPGFVVWDKSATIDFKKPGRGIVEAHFTLDQVTINAVLEAMALNKKCEPQFVVKILDSSGDTVALVHKTLSVKAPSHKKREKNQDYQKNKNSS